MQRTGSESNPYCWSLPRSLQAHRSLLHVWVWCAWISLKFTGNDSRCKEAHLRRAGPSHAPTHRLLHSEPPAAHGMPGFLLDSMFATYAVLCAQS